MPPFSDPSRRLYPDTPYLSQLAWLAVGLSTLAFWLFNHEGLYGLDDFFYARYAQQLAAGTFRLPHDPLRQLHDPLLHRPAVFGPVALAFRLGGVSIWAATLWPLLATLLTGVGLVLVLRSWPALAAAAAVVLLGLSQHTLWLACYLYGDNVVMLFALAAAGALAAYRRQGRHPVAWALLFVVANLAAWLAKETVGWYAPAYAAVAFLDWRAGRHRQFWLVAGGVGTAVLATYFALYAALTGDPWQRFHVIETTNSFLRSGSYADRPFSALVARLTWDPVAMLAATGLAAIVWPALAAALRPGWRARLALRGPDAAEGYWLLLALIGMAQWWLGTTSLQFWNPPALNPRFLTPLLPPLAALAGLSVLHWHRGLVRGSAMAVGFLVLAVVARNSVSLLYLLLAGVAWWFGAERRAHRPRPAVVIVVLGLLLAARPAYQLTRPPVTAWREQQTLIRENLTAAAGPAVVFTDRHLLDTYPFWYGFAPPPNLEWRQFIAHDSIAPAPPRRAWLLLNHATLQNPDLPKLYGLNPASILAQFPNHRLVRHLGPVYLYEVGMSNEQ